MRSRGTVIRGYYHHTKVSKSAVLSKARIQRCAHQLEHNRSWAATSEIRSIKGGRRYCRRLPRASQLAVNAPTRNRLDYTCCCMSF